MHDATIHCRFWATSRRAHPFWSANQHVGFLPIFPFFSASGWTNICTWSGSAIRLDSTRYLCSLPHDYAQTGAGDSVRPGITCPIAMNRWYAWSWRDLLVLASLPNTQCFVQRKTCTSRWIMDVQVVVPAWSFLHLTRCTVTLIRVMGVKWASCSAYYCLGPPAAALGHDIDMEGAYGKCHGVILYFI